MKTASASGPVFWPMESGRGRRSRSSPPPGSHADGDGGGGGERQHRGIDQEFAGAEIIDHGQQQEAADPGEIGLVFEPVQLFGQGRRRHHELPRVIEAAAMDHPAAAGNAFGLARLAAQAGVEPDEMEGGADPGDAQHHMAPAQQQVHPIPGVGSHRLSMGFFRLSRLVL
jgi:hypothetical protein